MSSREAPNGFPWFESRSGSPLSRRSNQSPLFESAKRPFPRKRERLCAPKGNFGSNPGISETQGRIKAPYLRAFWGTMAQKTRDGTGWLGRQDSNLEMAVSKIAFETTAELAELGIANRPRDFCTTKLLNLHQHLPETSLASAASHGRYRQRENHAPAARWGMHWTIGHPVVGNPSL